MKDQGGTTKEQVDQDDQSCCHLASERNDGRTISQKRVFFICGVLDIEESTSTHVTGGGFLARNIFLTDKGTKIVQTDLEAGFSIVS